MKDIRVWRSTHESPRTARIKTCRRLWDCMSGCKAACLVLLALLAADALQHAQALVQSAAIHAAVLRIRHGSFHQWRAAALSSSAATGVVPSHVVTVSQPERAACCPAYTTVEQAKASLQDAGFVVLRACDGLIDSKLVDAANEEAGAVLYI